MRGCACRGDSAGFVHLECLTKLAMSKEASGDAQTIYNSWTMCAGTANLQGALEVEMKRRFWRRNRSGQNQTLRYHATKCLANCLEDKNEIDASDSLHCEASKIGGNGKLAVLNAKLANADMLLRNDQRLQALDLLEATLPEAKEYTGTFAPYCQLLNDLAEVLRLLKRYDEALDKATELLTFLKAKFGPENPDTLSARLLYAMVLADLGRLEERTFIFEVVLRIQTRIFGRDHPTNNKPN